jgi:hypothetical protein
MATTANAFATASQITAKVGAMVPLGQISSVVQTLSNIQGFNAGAFGQLSGTIQSALQGFDQASSLVQGFASGSPVQAFTSALGATGLAGSSISSIAGASASAYRQADSFLSSVASVQSWQRLNSQRPGVEEARATNRPNSGLSFPKDIGKYWIYLGFEEANFSTIMGSSSAVFTRRGSGSVTLPLPMNLSDTSQLEYENFTITDAAKRAAGGFGELAGGITKLAGFFGIADSAADPTALARFAAKFSGAQTIAGAAIETAGALTGYAVNTHQTLKFKQPTLKSHSFSWKLVPSNKEESKILRAIVQFIKSRIYPKANGLVFTYPNLVNVYLYNKDSMYLFKPAYVTGFAVNYTTEGGPAFHNDEYPVSVQIDMNITETAVWTKNDAATGGY